MSVFYASRKERQDVSAYRALLASPAAVSVVLPANGTFALVSRTGNVATPTAYTVQSHTLRSFGAPAMSAGTRRIIGRFYRGSTVTLSAGFDLYLNVGLGVYRLIAEGA